jgi:hypothetical protein
MAFETMSDHCRDCWIAHPVRCTLLTGITSCVATLVVLATLATTPAVPAVVRHLLGG